jgi:parallel beta-helix repeat protein
MKSLWNRVFLLLVAAAAPLPFAAPEARAADLTLEGSKLQLRRSADRGRLTWLAKGEAVALPAGTADPTVAGASLRLIASSGEEATFDLPAAGWTRSEKAFRFRGGEDSTVRSATLRAGKLLVRGSDPGLALGDPAPEWVGLILAAGDTRYCAIFDSGIRVAEPGRFDAAGAPAPAACPVAGSGSVVWRIDDGPDEQAEALAAFFAASAGDTIEFGEGAFELTTTLLMAHRAGITIRGQGEDKTILDFLHSNTPEGISLSHMTGVTIEDLTILDTPGFSLKVSDSDYVVIRNLRAMWSSADSDTGDAEDDRGGMDPKMPSTLDVTCVHELSFPTSTGTYTDRTGAPRFYQTSSSNGGYAIYPVLSNDVLLDNVTSIGASDAGIYVGQSNDIIVKNSEALFNVAGYEIENSDRADMFDNVAHCNTGGFLVFDLPGLNQYGEQTRVFDNYAGYNNTANFAPGGVVTGVPQGVGMLQLGYDQVEVFRNTIEFNRSLGFVAASHELLDGNTNNPDLRMDLYPEGIHLHDNIFTTNGTSPQPPEEGVIVCAPGTGGSTGVPCVPTGINDGHDSLLPALVMIKGTLAADGYGPTGAHVVWDGMLDRDPYACDLAPEFQTIVDERGKPQYTGNSHPTCRYDKYKFADPSNPATRKHPDYWMCVVDQGQEHGNTFSPDARKFLNFENTDPTDPPEVDIAAHDCPARFGSQLANLPAAVVDEYVPGEGGETPPTQAEIEAICNDYTGNAVNRDALPFNCPKLSQYNLFADRTDPRTGANDGGVVFDLTTPLFSDYAVKYRFAFLPPASPAAWVQGDATSPNATLDFPIGTVLTKTFAFRDGASEEVVETRLLIHRAGKGGSSHWEGLAYIWDKDGSGNRTDAHLAIGGGTVAVHWNFEDPDPDVTATYVGSTDRYSVPQANQCGSCHQRDDVDPGDAPIGPKVRNLNRPMSYGAGTVNQLQHWIDAGRISGAPALTVDAGGIATNVQRNPRFNVPGDAWMLPVTDAFEQNRYSLMSSGEIDTERRARAWLESNCAHCHNQNGNAQSTGVFFDVFRKVNINFGVCKTPTTAGSSSGGHDFDILPGSAPDSILSYRIRSNEPGSQMPPIARSVVHGEGSDIVDEWISTVIDSRFESAGCEQ